MSVIAPFCGVSCDGSQGCGCADRKLLDTRAPSAAVVTGLAAAVACTACCILPLTLPPILLGVTGGFLALLDRAHGSITKLAIGVVIAAWLWIGWQVAHQKRRITGLAISLMILATTLTAVASAWPILKPFAFRTLGVTKGIHRAA